MARAGRSFEEGRIYHVYNRVGGGSKASTDEELAATFVALLRLSTSWDGAPRGGGRGTRRRSGWLLRARTSSATREICAAVGGHPRW